MDNMLSKALREFTTGPLNQLIVNLGGKDGDQWEKEFNRFLRKESCWNKRWIEKDGVITFTLPPTDGTTGEQWITRTEEKGNHVGDYAKQLLRSKDFKPTTGKVYQVQVLKGELFSNDNRSTKNIRAKAKKHKLITPNAEMACLIRENFSGEELEEMGLTWLVIMHEPIKYFDCRLGLLGVRRSTDGQWFHGYCDSPSGRWDRGSGFAFAAA